MSKVLIFLVMLGAAVHGRPPTVEEELTAKYNTLPFHEFMEYFNNQDFSWKMAEYKETRLVMPRYINHPNATIQIQDDVMENLPTDFDSRKKWPNCKSISMIFDQQEKCGSCWAFGTVTAMSDRTCIVTRQNILLSEQDMDCETTEPVCKGGNPGMAYKYWVQTGVVTASCKPYNSQKLHVPTCDQQCINGGNYQQDKHFGKSSYAVSSDENAIKTEIFKNGPITATFYSFDDLKFYKSGVYEHKFGEPHGMHAVRVLGWGEEGGKPYWLIANSWGENWGDSGYIKIMRNQRSLELEAHIDAGLPKA